MSLWAAACLYCTFRNARVAAMHSVIDYKISFTFGFPFMHLHNELIYKWSTIPNANIKKILSIVKNDNECKYSL